MKLNPPITTMKFKLSHKNSGNEMILGKTKSSSKKNVQQQQ